MFDPDPLLAHAEEIIASANSAVLDQCRHWFNLTREVIKQSVPDVWIIDLGE